MGFFSFLKKKQPESKGAEGPKLDLNLPPMGTVTPHPSAPPTPEAAPSFEPPLPEPSMPPMSPLHEQPSAFREAESYRGEMGSREMTRSIDMISAKLDAIKAMIETLNHRLDKMEQKDKKEKETIRW